MGDSETGGQHWSLPCPGCHRPLAIDLTADEVAGLVHDRAGVVTAHRPEPDAGVVILMRWNVQHTRRCRYRVVSDQE